MIRKSKELWNGFVKRFLKIDENYEPRKIAFRISVVFLLCSTVWIVLTDTIVEVLDTGKSIAAVINIAKGFLFITITGALIYTLIFSVLKALQIMSIRLSQSYKELAEAHRNLGKAYDDIKDNEERYRLVLEASNDGIWDLDLKSGRVFFSDRWYDITGYSRDEINKIDDWKELIHPDDSSRISGIITEHINQRTPSYSCDYRFKTKNGDYRWVRERGKAIFDGGSPYRIAASFTDINQLKKYEQNLINLAYNDSLTNLSNKRALNLRLNNISKNADSNIALYLINIDNFKNINDTMGHSFGDKLLVIISTIIKEALSEKDSLYRLGADEFVVLAKDVSEQAKIKKIAEDIMDRIRMPIQTGNVTLHITASIGISIFPDDGKTRDEILKNADIAMHKAKEQGKSKIIFYSSLFSEPINRRMRLEYFLHKALENKEFVLYYQPQAEIKRGVISGFEALVRWISPELGFVAPQEFIWILEDTRLIIQVGRWILKEACTFIKNINRSCSSQYTVSVNISMVQLLQDDFIDIVTEVLKETGLEPEYLELELTESILMESLEVINSKLEILKNMGIRIALDDFGKGYSSFNYLKLLPITTLKIDKSFIDNITIEEKSSYIAGVIIELGKKIGLSVVAEGVETKEQLRVLKGHDCEKIQGYLYCKPQPLEEIIKFMETKHELMC